MIFVSPATMDDFPAIARVAELTWADTYVSTPPQVQARLMEHFYSPDALRRASAKPGSLFLVARADETLAGFALFVDLGCGAMELTRLYVLPAYQRRGIGRALLQSGLNMLPGWARTVKVAVEIENRKARSFYETQGFRPCGESVVPAAGTLFHLALYERAVDEGRSS